MATWQQNRGAIQLSLEERIRSGSKLGVVLWIPSFGWVTRITSSSLKNPSHLPRRILFGRMSIFGQMLSSPPLCQRVQSITLTLSLTLTILTLP